jgi:hypothetical protein
MSRNRAKVNPKTAAATAATFPIDGNERGFALGIYADTSDVGSHVLPYAMGSHGVDAVANPSPSGNSIPHVGIVRVKASVYDVQMAEHAAWGASDSLPRKILTRLSQVPIASRAVFDMASLLVGRGVLYVSDADLQKGESNISRAFDSEIDAFIRRNRLYTATLYGLANDISSIYNGFVECITDSFGEKIIQIRRLPATNCRLSRLSETTMRSDFLYYSNEFGVGLLPNYNDPKSVVKLPLFDPDDFGAIERMKAEGITHFAYHIKPPSPQYGYYAVAPWNGIYLDSGWADVAAAVPRIVKAMQDNQIALKYIIWISEQYMISRFPRWSSMLEPQRKAAQDQVTAEIERKIVGVDRVFSSLTMIAKEGPDGKMYGKIQVVPIEDKAKTGTWIPDTAAANREILYGHMANPTLVGIQAQGGAEAGSGSDKLQSRNNSVSQFAILQELLYEPLNFLVKEWNGWAYTFLVDNIIHTTTNNQESGIVPSDKRPTIKN